MTDPDNKQEFINLINKYLQGKASSQEILFLEKYYNYFDKEEGITTQFSEIEKEILEKELLAGIWKKTETIAPVIPLYKRAWFRIAAAAVIILFATGTYVFLNQNSKKDIAKTGNSNPYKNDVAPGGNKAILTLADGSTIVLDSAKNGTLTQQGNTKILKLENGQLAYNTLNEKPTEIFYNTVSTPRGGQYQLTLADGSKIWLNAASSLRFPATFTGKERKVELTGEAYFEVAKNVNMPFKVTVNDMTVEVLGTHFNINSYSDEAAIKTTLLEGAVKVSKGNVIQMLSPGQQALLNSSGEISLNTNPDIENVIAWKNALFNFTGADIENIMRQISRWYDVDVTYEGKINKETFSGIVSRNNNVSQILKIMEKGSVKFRIEGNPPADGQGKIIVLE